MKSVLSGRNLNSSLKNNTQLEKLPVTVQVLMNNLNGFNFYVKKIGNSISSISMLPYYSSSYSPRRREVPVSVDQNRMLLNTALPSGRRMLNKPVKKMEAVKWKPLYARIPEGMFLIVLKFLYLDNNSHHISLPMYSSAYSVDNLFINGTGIKNKWRSESFQNSEINSSQANLGWRAGNYSSGCLFD
jgi:hypothetical protein